MTAATRVHRRDELEAGRIEDGAVIGAGDGDLAGLERLAQTVENLRLKFRQFVEKQHAMMRQRNLARPRMGSAADERRHGGRVMRRTKRTAVGQFAAGDLTSDGMDLRDDPEAKDLSWSDAKRRQITKDGDFDHETWLDEKANKLAKQLLKVVTPKLIHNPEVLAESLRRIDSSLPRRLVEEWSDEVRGLMKEWEDSDI